METVYEPIIPKAIVNGLISTIVLWSFWMPFIVFIAVPLVSAMLKDAVCSNMPYMKSALPTKPLYQPAVNNLLNDNTELDKTNSTLKYSFIFTYFVVVGICYYFASSYITYYNLDKSNIIKFNIVMAIIIVLIEMSFFIGVTLKYVPFDPISILGDLTNDANSYYNTLTSK